MPPDATTGPAMFYQRAIGRLLLDLLLIGGTTAGLVLIIAIAIPLLAVPVAVVAPVVLLFYLATIPLGGVYRFALTRRYMRQKLTPLFAAGAVALCTAMVVIVISVMGGFLRLLTDAVQKLEGDVTLMSGLRGFPSYVDLQLKLEGLDEVESTAAVVRTYGLINMTLKSGDVISAVQILGISGEAYSKVINYGDTLYWTPARRAGSEALSDLETAGMRFETPPSLVQGEAIVPGISVSPTSRRDEHGQYDFLNSVVGREVVLTAMTISSKGIPTPIPKKMVVVNEFKSGLYEVDSNRVYVGFSFLQKALNMDRFEGEDEQGSPRVWPARANDIVVRGKAGVPLEVVYDAVADCAKQFIGEHPEVPNLRAQTWQQRHATFLGAVQKEKLMLTILFAIISLIAVAMIGVIFYMIVMEKTRDIGVLRAMGASRGGIAAIFLGYGLAIGVIGSLLGVLLAAAVVYNINEIQELLTRTLGFTMWDPRIYYFDEIPADLDPTEVTTIFVCAVLSGLLGAVVPALLAARLNPVEALRYE